MILNCFFCVCERGRLTIEMLIALKRVSIYRIIIKDHEFQKFEEYSQTKKRPSIV